MRSRSRLVPAIGVVVLMAATLTGPASRASKPVNRLDLGYCGPTLESVSGESTYVIVPPARYLQPVAGTNNLAECDVQSYDYDRGAASATMAVEFWDPAGLTPDPTTVALRSAYYGVSILSTDVVRLPLDPPVVVKAIPHLAEPPRSTVAIDYRAASNGSYNPDAPQSLHWSPDGDPTIPLAYDFTTGGAVPLPGPHGVLGHAVCSGAYDNASLRVCQSVMRCDTLLRDNVHSVVETFRVPARTELRWIEIAFGAPAGNFAAGAVAILDAASSPTGLPPADTTGALARANLGNVTPDTWGTHFDFDQTATLEPDHDYFLWVETSGYYGVYLRKRGTESADYLAGARVLWTRAMSGSLWFADWRHDLAFRVIGVPVDLVGVREPLDPPAGLALAVAPNPARSATTLRWTGARGDVRLEIFDPQGRRVANRTFTAAANSAWTWDASTDRGIAAGVYLVRVTDSAGGTASLRVTQVR